MGRGGDPIVKNGSDSSFGERSTSASFVRHSLEGVSVARHYTHVRSLLSSRWRRPIEYEDVVVPTWFGRHVGLQVLQFFFETTVFSDQKCTIAVYFTFIYSLRFFRGVIPLGPRTSVPVLGLRHHISAWLASGPIVPVVRNDHCCENFWSSWLSYRGPRLKKENWGRPFISKFSKIREIRKFRTSLVLNKQVRRTAVEHIWWSNVFRYSTENIMTGPALLSRLNEASATTHVPGHVHPIA